VSNAKLSTYYRNILKNLGVGYMLNLSLHISFTSGRTVMHENVLFNYVGLAVGTVIVCNVYFLILLLKRSC